MVGLTLTPYRGNHQRFFPCTGALGLTQVIVQGVVRTNVEEDKKLLKASKLIVRLRCYEADSSRRGKRSRELRVLYDQADVIWSKKDHEEWGLLGDLEERFRITVPVSAGGASTCTYKHYRVWWQVEAVIFHKSSTVSGSRKLVTVPVPIIRFNPSPLQYIVPPPSWSSSSPSTPSIKNFHFSISTAKSAYGPGDPIDLTVFLHRDDASIHVKRISVVLNRHVALELNPPPSTIESEDDEEIEFPLITDEDHAHNDPSRTGRASKRRSSFFERSNSVSRESPLPSPTWTASPSEADSYFTPRESLLPTPPAEGSTPSPRLGARITQPMGTMEISEPGFGVNISSALLIPKTKSLYRYSNGETCKTILATQTFSLNVKIHVKSRAGSETLELDPMPVILTAASDSERADAQAVYGKNLAIAEAESRIYGPHGLPWRPRHASSSASQKSALGTRRASNFVLSIDTNTSEPILDALPSPTRSVGSMSRAEQDEGWLSVPTPPQQGRNPASVRKRSEQWEPGAPVKTKAKFTGREPSRSPSPPTQGGLASRRTSMPYVASGLSHSPIVNDDSPMVDNEPPTPKTSSSSRFQLPHNEPYFNLSMAHTAGGHGDASSRRRFGGRPNGPYASARRPRSSGTLSVISQRSNEVSSGGSVSGVSAGSGDSVAGSRRQLPTGTGWDQSSASIATSTFHSQETLLLPLSLHSTPAPATEENKIATAPLEEEHTSAVIPVTPASPTLSDCSEFSTTSDMSAQPIPTSPAINFSSFSLTPSEEAKRKAIAPWESEDVSPFDRRESRQPRNPPSAASHNLASTTTLHHHSSYLAAPVASSRRSSASSLAPTPPPEMRRGGSPASELGGGMGRRKTSIGFGGLFGGKSGGVGDEEGKEGSKWAFLRRGSTKV
ncbi:hypothetical protein MNV49_007872 [Pseudohyphozyma bogoriensis]|nr:hypothetical protein MNV49_007872 [Pseudohyphozyma bogoriensis]